MPRYTDAVGHLHDLANEVDRPWFTFLCDYSTAHGSTPLSPDKLSHLDSIFDGTEIHVNAPSNVAVSASMPASRSDRLKRLFGFRNFKLLSETLDIAFTKQVTVIFGTNGSGKSSLCEALKVLANPEVPTRPLSNLRSSLSAPTEFQYQFDTNVVPQRWTSAAGHGLLSTAIKFFDTGVADRNVKVAVAPERIIEITPFKLNLFETLSSHIAEFVNICKSVRL